MKRIAALLIIALALAGCRSMFISKPSDEAIAEADRTKAYGPKPSQPEMLIKNHLRPRLKDPDSLKQFHILKEWTGYYFESASLLRDERVVWGWYYNFTYMGKNSYGAYNGSRFAQALIKDGRVMYMADMPGQ